MAKCGRGCLIYQRLETSAFDKSKRVDGERGVHPLPRLASPTTSRLAFVNHFNVLLRIFTYSVTYLSPFGETATCGSCIPLPFRFYRTTEQEVLHETAALVKPYTVYTANCMGNETVGQIIFEREPYSQDQTPPSLVFPPFYERNTKSKKDLRIHKRRRWV